MVVNNPSSGNNRSNSASVNLGANNNRFNEAFQKSAKLLEENFNKALKASTEGIKNLTAEAIKSNSAYKATEGAITSTIGNLEKFAKTATKTVITLTALSSIGDIFEALNVASTTAGGGFKILTEDLKNTTEAIDLMQREGFSTEFVGQINLATAAINGNIFAANELGKQSVVAYDGFRDSLTRLNTILRFTDEGLANLGDQIQSTVNGELKNSVTSVQAAAAQYEVISAGFTDVADSSKVMTAALKLSIAGMTDQGATARLLVGTLRAYKLEASEAAKVSSILQGVVDQGITTIEELSNGFAQTAGVAKEAGIKVNELGAAVAVLTQKGFSTPTALTAIQGLAATIIDKTPQAVEALQNLKDAQGKAIRFDIAEVRTKGFATALKDLNQAIGGSASKLAEIIPDIQAYRAAIGLMENDAKQLSEVTVDLGSKTAALLDNVFGVSLNNNTAKFTQTVNKFGETMIKLGKSIAPLFEEAVAGLNNNVNAISDFIGAATGLIKFFVEVSLKVKQFVNVLGTVIGVLGAIVQLFISVRGFDLLIGVFTGETIKLVRALVLLKSAGASNLEIFKQLIGIGKVNTAQLLAQAEASKSIINLTKIDNAQQLLSKDIKVGNAAVEGALLKNRLLNNIGIKQSTAALTAEGVAERLNAAIKKEGIAVSTLAGKAGVAANTAIGTTASVAGLAVKGVTFAFKALAATIAPLIPVAIALGGAFAIYKTVSDNFERSDSTKKFTTAINEGNSSLLKVNTAIKQYSQGLSASNEANFKLRKGINLTTDDLAKQERQYKAVSEAAKGQVEALRELATEQATKAKEKREDKLGQFFTSNLFVDQKGVRVESTQTNDANKLSEQAIQTNKLADAQEKANERLEKARADQLAFQTGLDQITKATIKPEDSIGLTQEDVDQAEKFTNEARDRLVKGLEDISQATTGKLTTIIDWKAIEREEGESEKEYLDRKDGILKDLVEKFKDNSLALSKAIGEAGGNLSSAVDPKIKKDFEDALRSKDLEKVTEQVNTYGVQLGFTKQQVEAGINPQNLIDGFNQVDTALGKLTKEGKEGIISLAEQFNIFDAQTDAIASKFANKFKQEDIVVGNPILSSFRKAARESSQALEDYIYNYKIFVQAFKENKLDESGNFEALYMVNGELKSGTKNLSEFGDAYNKIQRDSQAAVGSIQQAFDTGALSLKEYVMQLDQVQLSLEATGQFSAAYEVKLKKVNAEIANYEAVLKRAQQREENRNAVREATAKLDQALIDGNKTNIDFQSKFIDNELAKALVQESNAKAEYDATLKQIEVDNLQYQIKIKQLEVEVKIAAKKLEGAKKLGNKEQINQLTVELQTAESSLQITKQYEGQILGIQNRIKEAIAGQSLAYAQLTVDFERRKQVQREVLKDAEREKLLIDQQIKNVQTILELKKAERDIVKSVADLLSNSTDNEEERKRIAQQIAAQELILLRGRQSLERAIFEIQEKQLANAREQAIVQAEIAKLEAQKELVIARAEKRRVDSDPNSTLEQREAADINISSREDVLKLTEYQSYLLNEDNKVQEELTKDKRKQLIQKQRLEGLQASKTFASTTEGDKDDKQVERQIRRFYNDLVGNTGNPTNVQSQTRAASDIIRSNTFATPVGASTNFPTPKSFNEFTGKTGNGNTGEEFGTRNRVLNNIFDFNSKEKLEKVTVVQDRQTQNKQQDNIRQLPNLFDGGRDTSKTDKIEKTFNTNLEVKVEITGGGIGSIGREEGSNKVSSNLAAAIKKELYGTLKEIQADPSLTAGR